LSQQLVDAITDMRESDALRITKELLASGVRPFAILDDCRTAMEIVGQRYEQGEAFIPELMLAGEVLGQIAALVKPRMQESGEEVVKLGKIVFGTVEGDIHDIAKDIVVFMLDIHGFEVTDLGVDVPPARFVEAVRQTGAKIVGLSGFLTLAYTPMKETVAALKAASLDDVKVMVGGGQVDENIMSYTGADGWGRDAMDAVNLAKKWA
jgi:methanogenic corrinoid protein MtbC1